MRKKRTKITIETTRLSFASGNTGTCGWCGECGQPAWMVTVEQAASALGMNPAAVHERIGAARILSRETPEGIAFVSVCLDCLMKPI